MKSSYKVYHKYLLSIFLMMFLCGLMFYRTNKNKDDHEILQGEIEYFGKTYKHLPVRDFGKYRFIKLENSPLVFQIFLDDDKFDFSPERQKVNNLITGDSISIYYEHYNKFLNILLGNHNNDENLVYKIYFLTYNNETIFRRSDFDENVAKYGFIILLLMAFGLNLAKRKGYIN